MSTNATSSHCQAFPPKQNEQLQQKYQKDQQPKSILICKTRPAEMTKARRQRSASRERRKKPLHVTFAESEANSIVYNSIKSAANRLEDYELMDGMDTSTQLCTSDQPSSRIMSSLMSRSIPKPPAMSFEPSLSDMVHLSLTSDRDTSLSYM